MNPFLKALCFSFGAKHILTPLSAFAFICNICFYMMEELGLVGRPAFLPYVGGAASSDGSEFPPQAGFVSASIKVGVNCVR